MSQSLLAGCKRHRNWKGGWNMKKTKEKEIAEKSTLELSRRFTRDRGAKGPGAGEATPCEKH